MISSTIIYRDSSAPCPRRPSSFEHRGHVPLLGRPPRPSRFDFATATGRSDSVIFSGDGSRMR